MPTTLKWANSKTRSASSSYGMLTGSVIFGLVQASLFLESSSISFILAVGSSGFVISKTPISKSGCI